MVNRPTTNGRVTDTPSALGGYGAFFAPEPPEAEQANTATYAEQSDAVTYAQPQTHAQPPTYARPETYAQPEQAAAQTAEVTVPAPPRHTEATPHDSSGAMPRVAAPGTSGAVSFHQQASDPAAAPTQHASWSMPVAPPASEASTYEAPAAPEAAAGHETQAVYEQAAYEAPAAYEADVETQVTPEASGAPAGPQTESYAAPESYAAESYAAPEAYAAPARVDWHRQGSGSELIPTTFVSSAVLSSLDVANRATLKSTRGMRGALNKVGFKLGLSPAEQRAEERRTQVRRHLLSTYQIGVISVKGGVGRTTVTAALGSTFAGIRADRVVAIDANPHFGDLSTRTGRHPFGLTLRDLAQANDVDAFASVQAFTMTNSSDLDVVASAWTTEANVALSGAEYATGINILRRHYNLLLADCGTGVLDSATGGVLSTAQAVVVVTPATVGGVTGAVATLNWLHSHGLQHLVAKSIVAIVQHQPAKPNIDVDAVQDLFATAKLTTQLLPYDAHLAEGGEIDLRLVEPETRLAFEELAATLADGFPSYRGGDR